VPTSGILKGLTVPLAMALLAGCGSSASPGATGGTTFPLTLRTANGNVTIPQRPSRVVSLSATATEDLYAVGAGKQVVAVDSYSDYPANTPRTSLSGFQPNIEAIAGYRPDLVLVSDDTAGVVQQLGRLGIPVLMEPPAPNLDGAYAQLTQIGQATGHQAQAAAEVSSLKQQVQAALAQVPKTGRRLSVYHELDQTYFSANSKTFIGQIYEMLGLRNIADAAPGSNPYPQLSSEYITSADPDMIVLADTVCCNQSLATVRLRPGWALISAVEHGAVVAVKDEIASQWGPRIALFIQAVVDELKALRRSGQ
jgi:iron complex transport system substrate-binding protein